MVLIPFVVLGPVAARSPVHHDPDLLLYRPLAHQVIQADLYPFPYHGKKVEKECENENKGGGKRKTKFLCL